MKTILVLSNHPDFAEVIRAVVLFWMVFDPAVVWMPVTGEAPVKLIWALFTFITVLPETVFVPVPSQLMPVII